ncbi:MAG: Holliday junction resolvase RuvX [Lachnospiraceae bacterium]|nr:Holliday junction resolvase RuvX [Lachnospiraceae bacterium]MBQ7506368.1 Holliday junction resolvase RuvX [Lachnospiraceae bacterium]
MAGAETVLGLDFGDKTVGVAISDGLFLTAQALETIRRERINKWRRTLARIEEICKERGVQRIVLGLPKGLDGIEGERCALTREFQEALTKRLGLPVELEDERFTTAASERVLKETGVAPRSFKTYSDMVSAALILDSWMERRRLEGTKE